MPDKRRELWYLQRLREALQDFPVGEVVPGESPDFVVGSEESSVGVEITVFHLPPDNGKRPHQELQSLKDRAVKLAWQKHVAAGGSALYVSVYFSDPAQLTKATCDAVATEIADAISRTALPSGPDQGSANISWNLLPPGIASIRATASIDGQDQLWHADAGGWEAPVQPGHLQEVITRKHDMLPSVRKKCVKAWLVIVSDEFGRSAPARLSDAAALHGYASDFDSVLWLEPHAPRVRKLLSANKAMHATCEDARA